MVEACGPSGWVSDLCEELKLPILVCSTHEDAWLFENVKRKTDKDDAIKLAQLRLRLILLLSIFCLSVDGDSIVVRTAILL